MKDYIQGKNVVMAFKKDTYVPYVCATDMSIEIDASTVEVRTTGDGQWKKKAYQGLSFTMTLSGAMVFDDDNFDVWELVGNQFGLVSVDFQASYEDDATPSVIKSLRGTVLISKNSLSFTVGDIVKASHSFEGTGALIMFDGLVPCPSVITAITVDGQEDADGIVHVTYTYTGAPYQVKYLVDGVGNYVYALAGFQIDIPGLAVGSDHAIEIIPVCINDFEGTGLTQPFEVTQALTCDSEIDTITATVILQQVLNTHSGSATQMKYRIDGGSWINSPIDTPVSIAGLSVGAHTIEEVPICANGITGTGLTQNFTITVQPAQSPANYIFTNGLSGFSPSFRIYTNGLLLINESTTTNRSVNIPKGFIIRCVIQIINTSNPTPNHTATMKITDTTTTAVLYNNSQTLPGNNTLDFTFTANGDSFKIEMTAG